VAADGLAGAIDQLAFWTMHCGDEPGMPDCSPIGMFLSPAREKVENGRTTDRLRVSWEPMRDRTG
jgi:hypothetical protein